MIKRPHVMQDSIQDCGVACIEMICKFYNINIDRRYIQEETGYGMIGISLKAMEKFFSKVDANPEIVNISKINRLNKENREMINNSLPAIVFLEEEEIINHFVVIWHIGKKRILVSDPTHTKKEWINNKQFEKRAISYLFVEKPKNIFLNHSPKKVRFYGKFIKRNLKIFSLVMFFSIIVSLLSTYLSFNLGKNINILEKNIPLQEKTFLIQSISIGFIVLALVQVVVSYFKNILVIKGTFAFETQLFKKYINKMLTIHPKYFQLNSSGEFVSRISDILQVSNDVMNFFISVLLNFCMYVFSIITLFYFSKVMAIYLVVISAVVILFFAYIYPKIYHFGYTISKSNTDFQKKLITFIDGLEEFRALNADKYFSEKVLDKINKFITNNKKLQFFGTNSNVFLSLFNTVGTVILIAIGSLLVLKNSINLGNLTVLISLSGIVVSSLNQFGSFQAQYESMQVASHRLESILINMENENVCGEIILDKKIESIRCKRVSIKKINLDCLRSKLVFVEPNPKFLEGTIRDNLLLGHRVPNSIFNKLIRDFEINKILDDLPLGINFPGEAAIKCLSSGQKQKLALFRGILKRPDILLVDEGFSNMDKEYLDRILPKFDSWGIKLIVIDHSNRVTKDIDYITMENYDIKNSWM